MFADIECNLDYIINNKVIPEDSLRRKLAYMKLDYKWIKWVFLLEILYNP